MTLVQSRHRPAVCGITGPSEAVVDLSAVRDNVGNFRKRVPQQVLAMVKADAFGHGTAPVARAAVKAGATIFGDGSHGEPTVADWAGWAGTIPDDIYCGIGSRVRGSYE
ncbi:alanine racemase [Kribbella sp. NPDC055110]